MTFSALPDAAFQRRCSHIFAGAKGDLRSASPAGDNEHPAQLPSSFGRGASRAWGPVCTLVLLLLCLAAKVQAAPSGTPIANTAQATYLSWGISTDSNSNTVTTIVERYDTPSQIELLQYAPTLAGATLVPVPTTEYSDTGTTASSVTIAAIYSAGSAVPINLSVPVPLTAASVYHQGEPVFFRVSDMDQNRYPAAAETIWLLATVPGTSEAELLLLTETGPDTGVFAGYIQSGNLGVGTVDDFNGVLDVSEGLQIEARYTDRSDPADTVVDNAMVDPYGLVFDSATGLPVDNVQLTLVVDTTGAPATVYGDDGISAFPSTIASGGTFTDAGGKVYTFSAGCYRFPFVTPGTYRLVISPPSGYAAPSTVATTVLQTLPGAPFAIAAPGSRGEAFVLNPGPAIRMDIPVDPAVSGLWVQKSVNRTTAAIGDFVQYTVTVENNSGAQAANAVINDRLPLGFRYRQGSARLDGGAVADPQTAPDGRTLTFAIGTMATDAAARIQYITEVAAGAKPGRAENLAGAKAGGGLQSNTAVAAVNVKEDLFRSKNFIVGRVIADNCNDDPTDKADGVPGVRIYLEDGTFVITDLQGRYHFEGVASGTHVVQMDLETLPAVYETAACEKDTRWAATPFSRFVDLHGGTLWRADFHLQTKAPPSGQAHLKMTCGLDDETVTYHCEDQVVTPTQGSVHPQAPAMADGNTEELPAQRIEDIDLNALAPGNAWLMPAADFNPSIPSVKLAVQHAPTDKIELLLNGRPVSPLNFDGCRYNGKRTVAVSYWRGVDIGDGDNRFVAIFKNRDGQVTQRIERRVHYAGPAVKIELAKARSRLIANGRDAPLIAVRLTDKDGYPARFGTSGEFFISSPYQVYADKKNMGDASLTRLKDESPRYIVGRDGIAVIRLEPTTQSGYVTITIPLADKDHEVRAWLQPELRDWILVGLAEGTVGYHTVSGNMENLDAGDREEDLYQDGRMAFFAKGKVKGKWLLTAAYDSGRERTDSDTGLFRTIDPDTYYTLYGDGTRQQNEAPSVRKLYLKIEREQFYALFGDYDTGLSVTELSKYSRRFNGIKSEFVGHRWGYTAFATDTDQAFIKDEIRGNGTSGIYRLSRCSILPNSETVTIETRDRFRSEIIISSQTLSRHVDYNIDYDAGTIIFKAPVYSRDAFFNPTYIVAAYEARDASEESYIYGGRGSVQLAGGKVALGATYIHEDPRNAAADLGGVDARIELGNGLQIKAEAAATSKDNAGDEINGHAYLAEVGKHSADLDAKAYIREQGEGFGLGQQNGSEEATRKIGAEAAWRIRGHWQLSGELYRQYNLVTDAERDLAEARVEYHQPVYHLYTGLRLAEDRFDNSDTNRSTQLLLGGSRRFLDNRLQARISHEQSLPGNNESVDFPTRTVIGADYRIVEPVTLYAEHEIAQGEQETSQSSRLGLKATPWSGGRIGSSVGRESGENSQRVFANLGLTQTWRINHRWSVDGGLDRTQTLHKAADQAPFNSNVPTAAGAEEDFTSISLGAAYRADLWSWTGRVESRTADSEDKWGVITGIAGEVRRGLGVSAGLEIFKTEAVSGAQDLEGGLRLSLAQRPKNTPWIVLDRLEYKFEHRKDRDEDFSARRIVNNLNANYRPHHKLQVAMQYGAKYVFDTIDDRSYEGYTDLTGVEARYDLTRHWDVGAHASVLHSWNAGQLDYRTGCSVGYAMMKNMWVSLGYNFTGFKDEDFSGADYTAAGPYLKLRLKFDQRSVRDMVNWFGTR